MVRHNKKILDDDLLDLFRGLKGIYASYLQKKEEKGIRNLLLLNEVYNSIVEIESILRMRKVEGFV
jgi:hypothetical protein